MQGIPVSAVFRTSQMFCDQGPRPLSFQHNATHSVMLFWYPRVSALLTLPPPTLNSLQASSWSSGQSSASLRGPLPAALLPLERVGLISA